MDTLIQKTKGKRGPQSMGYTEQLHLMISRELREWALDQPEGASALARKLLEEERQRRMTGAPHEQ